MKKGKTIPARGTYVLEESRRVRGSPSLENSRMWLKSSDMIVPTLSQLTATTRGRTVEGITLSG